MNGTETEKPSISFQDYVYGNNVSTCDFGCWIGKEGEWGWSMKGENKN